MNNIVVYGSATPHIRLIGSKQSDFIFERPLSGLKGVETCTQHTLLEYRVQNNLPF